MTDNRVSLPASVVSGESIYARQSFKALTETFSYNFKGLLPNKTLLQLGVIFKNADGKSDSYIKKTDQAINLMCKYMAQNDISDLREIQFGDLGKLQHFINREIPHNYWKEVFNCLKTNNSNTPLSDLTWPKFIGNGDNEGKTEGHTMYAYNAIGGSLRKEIDRIREKKGRLAEDLKTGRILELTDLILPGQPYCENRFIRKKRPEYFFNKADVIRTAAHYLPGWPVTNSLICSSRWGVYHEINGIRLGIFNNKEEADNLVKTYDGIAVTVYIQNETMNPAELLLYSLACTTIDAELSKYAKKVFCNLLNLIDHYFTTGYDWQCVYLYWSWLTGWNNEAIASVTASSINLGIDVGINSSIVEMVAPNHIEIKGKGPTSKTNGKQWSISCDSAEAFRQGTTITGYKTRSQPEDLPTDFIYVSDMSNNYDLYRVLSDFYDLTKPLRGFLQEEERDCILMGVASKRKDEKGRRLSIYGAPLHGTPPEYRETGLGRFFIRNAIYDDEREGLDHLDPEADQTANDPASFPDRYTRILKTTVMKMRNTFDTALKATGVPLFVRKAKLRHKSDSTTNTSYGADKVEKGMRKRELRDLLNKVEQSVFQGQLQRYEGNNLALRKQDRTKVVQIFSHLQSDVFLCMNPKKPTWLGHEEYVQEHCIEFDECLFCKNCLITPESLPILVRWRHDIKAMPKLVGPVGISDKIYLRLQAIDEVFELCRNGGQEWQSALEMAYEIEMDPAFTAPDIIHRNAAQLEG